ncbi:unnamed protein product [Orchesella dallaii]|uniref:Innexin n=1 Tax=Orchesella dallaii TaxID=48710 RepID=A0ABP1S3M6_9HEXA
MFEVLNILYGWFKKEKVHTDTIACQFVYRLLAISLFAFAAVSQLRQFSGNQISCIESDTTLKEKIDSICLTSGTYTFPPPTEEDRNSDNIFFLKGIKADTLHFVEAYPGIRSWGREEPERIHHRNYMFVPFYFLILGFFCYIPRIFWKKVEQHQMIHWVQDLNSPVLDMKREEKLVEVSARNFAESKNSHKRYCIYFLFVHLLNIALMIGQLLLLYWVTGSDFYYYGLEVFMNSNIPPQDRPDGLSRNYPLVALCDVRIWSITGNIRIISNMCFLHMNDVFQLLFGCQWWLLCLCIPIATIAATSHLVKIVCPCLRRWELKRNIRSSSADAHRVIDKLNFGSSFVVYMMAKNVPAQTLDKILSEVSYDLV